jgi:hypothetical protein
VLCHVKVNLYGQHCQFRRLLSSNWYQIQGVSIIIYQSITLEMSSFFLFPFISCGLYTVKSSIDVVVCFIKNPERNPDPERIEEDQIYPEIHEVAGIQIRIFG